MPNNEIKAIAHLYNTQYSLLITPTDKTASPFMPARLRKFGFTNYPPPPIFMRPIEIELIREASRQPQRKTTVKEFKQAWETGPEARLLVTKPLTTG